MDDIEAQLLHRIASDVSYVTWETAPDVLRLPSSRVLDGYDRNQFDMWKEAWQVEASRLGAIIEKQNAR